MNDNKNQLREDAIEFAIQISDLCDEIKGCSVYVNQIVRSSSSIGANIHEAKYAQSKADFVNKLEGNNLQGFTQQMRFNQAQTHRLHHYRKGKRLRINVSLSET
jgi:hypothetical protein